MDDVRSPVGPADIRPVLAALVGRAAARRLVDAFGHAFAMARATPAELSAKAGLADGAARRVGAAFELGRRALAPPWEHEQPFCGPQEVWDHYRPELAHLDREVFFGVGLDARCRRIIEVRVAEGRPDHCIVDPAELFRPLLRAAARNVVLVHNHPSGDPAPSEADRHLTRRLAMAGQLLGIAVADHVIVGLNAYHSMAEEGVLP